MPSPELRSLGRLGRGIDVRGPSRRRGRTERRGVVTRRRRRVPRPVLAVLVVALLLAAWTAFAASGQTDEFANLPAAPSSDDGDPAQTADREAAATARTEDRASRSADRTSPAFARVGDVELLLPSRDAGTVGFAEAGRGTARPLTPRGGLVENANEGKFAPGDDTAGPDYVVLPSRGEPWPATSSAAVVLPRRARVHAPVSGQVSEVARYPMADGAQDVRIRIVPDDDTDVAVELRHLTDAQVAPGDRVDAGQTVVGVVRSVALPHPVDALVADDEAHLRVEVRPARTPGAPDPNAPAEEDPGS